MSILLDEEGAITLEFEKCLQKIFAKYCVPPAEGDAIPENASLPPDELDAWAKDTNGEVFSAETKEELLEFMDVNERGELTLKGFMQVYQLQTENEEEETWKDLAKHGFDRNLKET